MARNSKNHNYENNEHEKIYQQTASRENDIAIIGIACRFPGAENYEDFWKNIAQGVMTIQEIPQERWDWREYWGNPRTEKNKSFSKWGGFIDHAEAFDPGFFHLSAREVEAMDPQQRIMLELTWSCLEDAGIRPSTISGEKVGAYIGVFNFDYKELQEKYDFTIEAHHATGTAGAVIPNRISHYFNLRGPSCPVDTACSSSLHAIHLACQSLRQGECNLALAGGVSLLFTPTRHISFSQTGMLSPTGSCKTFDERADGYVRGEGAGLILLKPLEKALEDGDAIYAVLKGSAVNHNGKTRTITYPDAKAQAEVIIDACQQAEISPDSISYIEAHGTGTPKGDPMEFQGLLNAFHSLASKQGLQLKENYCGLGSAKPNIGHLESAAGIAGVIKVLLSMKYGQLPGLPNFQELNHRISLEKSPFYIANQLREWKPLTVEGESHRVIPRRAGVSSFGFGGTNAHVILEESPATVSTPHKTFPCYLFCLSATTEKALQQKESDLSRWLQETGEQYQLADISANLLLKRDHFEVRAAFIAKSVQELQTKLQKVLNGESVEGYFHEAQSEKEEWIQPLLREFGQTIIKKFTATKKVDESEYEKKLLILAELYTKGYNLNWEIIYTGHQVARLRMPTYPFAREHYWLPTEQRQSTHLTTTTRLLHPLVHCNTSILAEQRYTSTLTGQEFFLGNHRVQGQQVLPAVAYLEMIRAAIEMATAPLINEHTRISLRDIVWMRPIIVDHQPIQIHISLFSDQDDHIACEIYSRVDEPDSEKIIHCQGKAVLQTGAVTPILDVPSLQIQCNQQYFSSDQCYETFRSIGLDYGTAFQALEQVYAGTDQILAKITLPSGIAETQEQFNLHPSMMDAAMQAAVGFMQTENPGLSPTLALPFALEEFDIIHPCSSHMWAWLRPTDHDSARREIRKLDITFCDESGNICVQMRGLTLRPFRGASGTPESDTTIQTLLFHPIWNERPALPEPNSHPSIQHWVVLCEPEPETARILTTLLPDVQWLYLQSDQLRLDERFTSFAFQLLAHLQRLLHTTPRTPIQIQLMVWMRPEQLVSSGLLSLLRVARLEHPTLLGQMIEVEPAESAEHLAHFLQENWQVPYEQHIRYQAGRRWIAGWNEILPPPTAESPLWQEGGVYLISGGSGGLARLLIQEITRHIQHATVMLVGRSAPDTEKVHSVLQMATRGLRIEYQQADVSESETIHQVIKHLVATHGKLNGIIHSAGIIQDMYLSRKSQEAFEMVLAPKVKGLVNLDEASQQLSLDWFILFSSMVGALGNPGQVDYASANGFLDAYARYRNQLVAEGKRQGRTLSINWPLWQEGGMHVDEAIEREWRRTLGMIAMRTESGLQALSDASASHHDQVLVMEGEVTRLKAALLGKQPPPISAASLMPDGAPPVPTTVDQEELQDKAIEYFKQMLASVVKLPLQRINPTAPLDTYGIDSILVMQFTSHLERIFGPLSKTLLFEYRTLQELTAYFLEDYHNQLVGTLGLTPDRPSDTVSMLPLYQTLAFEPPLGQRRHRKVEFTRVADSRITQAQTNAADIAIIGLAGRYPGAHDIQEFWKNLQAGKDCITEIPMERWDHSIYYDPDKNKTGTTYSKWGGFLDNVDCFDPLFFQISPREAEMMDPQERLFLECVFATLEDAGYTREELNQKRDGDQGGNVGVYVGVMYTEYQLYGAQEQVQGHPIAIWQNPSSIANRVSYFCNFHGPSMAIDTMCSSSLTAIHLACQSLQLGECTVAVAGGVNLSLHPNKYLLLAQSKFISSKGRCESFGNGGDGYVPGEGVGAVLLKPLAHAVADGDHIYGVIKSSAINHGGKTNGYTVPNPQAQANVIGHALKEAHIDPRMVSYLEAHGTGTALGDPIEMTGLARAFRTYTSDTQFCSLGSVKSNIGHGESAAGIAGLTKVLLQFQHKQLVPSLHSEILNPHIDFQQSPFVVQRELAEWTPQRTHNGNVLEYSRIAGISSFGAGGSNAHVLVEEYLPAENQFLLQPATPPPSILIVLSARTTDQLNARALQLLGRLQEGDWNNEDLPAIAYTLQVGREAMEERLALIVNSLEELKENLTRFLSGDELISNFYRGQVKRHRESLSIFSSDEELKTVIDTWIRRRKFGKLLDMWVKGVTVDWSKLYSTTMKRISLPTYPFSRQHYWIPDASNNPLETSSLRHNHTMIAKTEQASFMAPVDRSNDVLFLAKWQEESLASQKSAIPQNHSVILMVYAQSAVRLKETILNYYKQNRPEAIILQIELSHQTTRIADRIWACDVDDPAGIDACLQIYDTIDCCYFLSEFQEDQVEWNTPISGQQGNEIQLLRLIKSLKQNNVGKLCDFYVITQDNYRIADASINPYGGGITGLAYSIAQGDYRFTVRNMDISAEDLMTEESRATLWRLMLSEPPSDRGEAIKFKAGSRYKQVFPALKRSHIDTASGIKQGGVYVILGGSGTVGKIITRYLMEKHDARIVWIGRRPQTDAQLQEQRETFRSLGEPPFYIQADVTDTTQTKAVLGQIKRRYPVIHGAIYSGLVMNFENSIDKTTEKEFLDIFNVKSQGGMNFYTMFQNEPLDFMCYFSSAQAFSFSGAKDLCAYASGITFLDTFTRYIRRQASFPVGVINWGFWKSSLEEIAITKNTGALEDRDGYEAFEYFTHLLQDGIAHQIICLQASDVVKILMGSSNDHVSFSRQHVKPLLQTVRQNHCETNSLADSSRRDIQQELDIWISKLLLAQMQNIGMFLRSDVSEQEEDFHNKFGILEKYRRLFHEITDILESFGCIHKFDNFMALSNKIEAEKPDVIWKNWNRVKDTYSTYTDWKSRIILADTCMRYLPEILRGEVLATDVLFPDSSMKMVEGIYKDNSISDYFNNAMADVVESYVRQRMMTNPQTPVRIIEIGAGTGGTSAIMFSRLKSYAESIEYCYTDISKSFLLFAQDKFGDEHPYVTYKLWNIEKPLDGQNIESGAYDVIIATNVLHATRNIRVTLRHAKSALKTNGLLLINEVTRKTPFLTLTFGLLDGWWLYEDNMIRIPGSPLLSPQSWQKALEEEGFRDIYFPTTAAEMIGQQTIVAESDGLIWSSIDNKKEVSKKRASVPDHFDDHQVYFSSKESQQSMSGKDSITTKNPAQSTEVYIKDVLLRELSNTLKVPETTIDSDVAFFDYGVDSILATSFINQVNTQLPVNINTAVLFDYTTIDRLVSYITGTYGSQIQQITSQEDVIQQDDIALPEIRHIDETGESSMQEHGISDLFEVLERKFLADEISIDSLIDRL